MNKKINLFLLFLALFTLIVVGYFIKYFLGVQNNQPLSNYSVTLKPKIEAGLYYYPQVVNYPFVNTSPDSFSYLFVTLKEKIELLGEKYDDLFLASKRLAEILKWGNDLSPQTLDYLLTKLQSSVNQYIQKASLLEEKQKNEKLTLVKKHLKYFQLDLETYLRNSNKTDQEKVRLSDLENFMFSTLNKKIDLIIPPYQPLNLKYNLSGIEPGYYGLFFSTVSLPKYLLTGNSVHVGSQTVTQDTNQLKPDSLSFSRIVVDDKQENLILKLNNIYIPIKDKKWDEQYDPTQKLYRYLIPVPLISGQNSYLLDFRYKVSSQSVLILGQNIFQNQNNIQALFLEPLFFNKKSVLNKIVGFDQNNKSYYHFILLSQNRLSKQELSNLDISFQPIIDPEITLEKTSSIVSKKNTINIKSPLIKLGSILFPIFLTGLILALLIYYRKLLKIVLIKLRLPLLIMTIVSVLFNILFINWATNTFFLPSLFFWILTLIGYNIEERISLLIAMIFLIICPFFLSLNNTIMAEKLAIYAYLFLLTGGIHSLIYYIKFNKYEKVA